MVGVPIVGVDTVKPLRELDVADAGALDGVHHEAHGLRKGGSVRVSGNPEFGIDKTSILEIAEVGLCLGLAGGFGISKTSIVWLQKLGFACPIKWLIMKHIAYF